MEIPVYLISGFLESGKTSFIKETLSDENFSQGEKTLVVLTEEGLEELDKDFLKKYNCDCVVVEDEEEFTKEFVNSCTDKYKPDRVLVECNGMWDMETFYRNITMPWMIVQIITTIDATTFEVYFNNMRQLIISHLLNSNMVIINRCDKDNMDLASFRRMIKGANRRCEIYFENSNGEIMEVRDEILPYDINADIIEIEDDDYGLWYLDISDNPEKYDGKTVKVKGMYHKPDNYPKGTFVHGRKAMTCCEEDISLIGLICITQKDLKLKNGDWITLTAKVSCRENKQYNEKMAILLEEKVEKSQEPENTLVSFS